MPFVFYDTETTGANRDFDQILQFAAILTDDNLVEQDRFEVRCRRLPWVVPDPSALLVNGIAPSQLDDAALPNFREMMSIINERLRAWSPAIYVGYNSFRFDEPILQRALWQALFPPYLTITNGNRRIDLLPLIQALSCIAPNVLRFPRNSKRKRIFRLDAVAPANGFGHHRAHDAMGDVEATIHLAKILLYRAKSFWTATVRKTHKSVLKEVLCVGQPVLVMDYFAGSESFWWGTRIDEDASTNSRAFVARLDHNWETLANSQQDELTSILSVKWKLLRGFTLNKSPLIFDRVEARSLCGMKPTVSIQKSAQCLSRNEILRQRLVRTRSELDKMRPTQDAAIEQRIFEGFPSRSDTKLMEAFHTASSRERVKLVKQFEDDRIRRLARRLIYLESPDEFPVAHREKIRSAIAARLLSEHDDRSSWRTISAAVRELDDLRIRQDNSGQLASIAEWLTDMRRTLKV